MIYNVNEDVKWFDFQLGAIKVFYNSIKFAVTIARQHGKTFLGRQVILDFLFRYKEQRNPTAIVLCSTVAQADELYLDELWNEYLKDLPSSVCWKKGSTQGNHIALYIRRAHNDIAKVLFLGANSSARGLTANFLLADEIATFQKDLLPTVYFPMLDATGGRAYLTSTIRGDDHYWALINGYRELQKVDSYYGEYERNIISAGLRTDEEIKRKEAEYKATGQYHMYLQEYMNYPYAAAMGEAPFAEKIWHLRQKNAICKLDNAPIFRNRHININLDIGKGGNNRIWAWLKPSHGPIMIYEHTEDLETLLDLPRYLSERYKHVPYINIFPPSDICTPSVENGGTYLSNLEEIINRMGLQKQIRLYPIPKTKNVIALVTRGVEFLKECVFDAEGTATGLNRLSGARFKKEPKTKEIIYGKFVNNGHQHTADGWNYIPAVLDNNLLPDHPIDRSQNVLNFYNKRHKWNMKYS